MIPAALQDLVQRAPWSHVDPAVLDPAPPGRLGLNEAMLMYHLALEYYRGEGCIVDAGAYLGRSGYLIAVGLEESARKPGSPGCIHSYDSFVADPHTVRSIREDAGVELRAGESFRYLFDRHTREYAELFEVHEGDFMQTTWSPQAVEILIVDLAKTREIHGKILRDFYGSLIPGRSLVVHQDYHHWTLPWIAIGVEVLKEYFAVVVPRVDFSLVLLNTKKIPAKLIERATGFELDAGQQLSLLDAAIDSLQEADRHFLRSTRINLRRELCDPAELEGEIDELSTLTPVHRWVEDREHWMKGMAELRSAVLEAIGWEAFSDGEFEKARDYARRAAVYSSDSVQSQCQLYALASLVLDDVSGAREATDQAQKDDPASSVAKTVEAQIAFENGELSPEQQEVLDADAERGDTILRIYHDALLSRAWALVGSGDRKGAEGCVRRVPTKTHGDQRYRALHLLALLSREAGRQDEARQAAQKAIDLDPKRPEAHFEMAWLLMDQHKPHDALVSARAAVANTDVDRAGADAAWAFAALSDAARRCGETDEAISAAQRALALIPDNAYLLCRLARAQEVAGSRSEARASAERALAVDPDSDDAKEILTRVGGD